MLHLTVLALRFPTSTQRLRPPGQHNPAAPIVSLQCRSVEARPGLPAPSSRRPGGPQRRGMSGSGWGAGADGQRRGGSGLGPSRGRGTEQLPVASTRAQSYPGPDDAGLLRKLLKRRSSGAMQAPQASAGARCREPRGHAVFAHTHQPRPLPPAAATAQQRAAAAQPGQAGGAARRRAIQRGGGPCRRRRPFATGLARRAAGAGGRGGAAAGGGGGGARVPHRAHHHPLHRRQVLGRSGGESGAPCRAPSGGSTASRAVGMQMLAAMLLMPALLCPVQLRPQGAAGAPGEGRLLVSGRSCLLVLLSDRTAAACAALGARGGRGACWHSGQRPLLIPPVFAAPLHCPAAAPTSPRSSTRAT